MLNTCMRILYKKKGMEETMITTMNHTSFTVSDLQKSLQFYQDVLGLEVISLAERDNEFSSKVSGVNDAKMNIAYIKAGSGAIELIEYVSGKGQRLDTTPSNTGSAHVCFNIKDFDKWMEHLKINHVTLRGEVCIVPAGPNKGRKVVYAADIDGNNLEFIEEVLQASL